MPSRRIRVGTHRPEQSRFDELKPRRANEAEEAEHSYSLLSVQRPH